MNPQYKPNDNPYETALAKIKADIGDLVERLELKRVALKNSDVAVNALSDLIIAAANGDAQTESGSRLNMADAVKAASELRQIHQVLTAEVNDVEEAIRKAIRRAHVEQDHVAGQWAPRPC